MLQDQQKQDKKLRLNSGKYSTLICLSTKHKCLEFSNRCEGKDTVYWSKVRLSDLEPSIQHLFQKIQSLYDYICENSQELEIEKNLVRINLNFLKQTKELRVKLHPMNMCSQEELDALRGKIGELEREAQNLKIGREGMKKLTFRLYPNSLYLDTYTLVNFNQIKYFGRNRPSNMLRMSEDHRLPKNGVWGFFVLVVDILPPPFGKSKEPPFLQIGIKNDQGEKQTMKLLFIDDQEMETTENSRLTASKNELLCVMLNMELRKAAISKKFEKGQKQLSWGHFKGNEKLWPHLGLYRLHITTDLFMDEEAPDWSDQQPQPAEQEQTKENKE